VPAVAWHAPGFGNASKPRDFPHAVDGHAAFISKTMDTRGIDRAHPVVHDFGGGAG
jgi:pimeloyl-ACP methyl ester carboxylesterase